VNVEGAANVEGLATLIASLREHLPTLIRAQVKLSQRVAKSVKVLVEVGAELPEAVGKASLQAGACIAASASAVAQASVRVNVSVKASASVTGRAGASI
jgi:hypothetical protein